jgi:hypothetical protein
MLVVTQRAHHGGQRLQELRAVVGIARFAA